MLEENPLIQGKTIWDLSRIPDRENTRIENPCLIRFKGHWYCSVGESPSHNPHPMGRGRIIRSADGENWESVKLITWEGGSVAAGLTVTAEGLLMAYSGLYFVSREPRPDLSTWKRGDAPLKQTASRSGIGDPNPMLTTSFRYYQLDPIGTVLNLPDNDLEHNVTHQFVTWLSSDGEHWSSAYTSPDLINTEPFRVTWHNGMGYVVGQWGKDAKGTLYRTRDGKNWRVLLEAFGPDERCNEGCLAFGKDETAYCLFRDGVNQVMIGIGEAPYYQDWQWKVPDIDYGSVAGGPRPAPDALGTSLGGPQLIRLSDGRLLGAGRALGPRSWSDQRCR